MSLTLDRQRFVDTMQAQAEIGKRDDGGLLRLAISDEDREVRDWFYEQMEAAGLYPLAAEHRIEALAICTVSDNIPSGEALSSDERATTFDEMITVALETVRSAG